MADLITMLSAVAGQQGEEVDEDFNQTVLLLHGDGTNGAQNNTFLDSSTNNFTITRNGNTTQGTFSPFSLAAGEWSNYFDGTDDYLSVADNAVLRPGAGAFTLEAWIYRNASGAAHTVYAKGGASTGIVLQVTSTNVLRFTHTTTNIDSTGTVAANAWVHVAVVREGTGTNQTKLYINGVQDGQGTVSTDFTQTEEVRIGTNRGATDDFAGYISNVRFVKGSALYTAGFTPSTVPLTTTSQGASSSEVELLTCQSNRFVDNSTNAFAITRNGDVRVTPFSPFAPTAAYSASTNGGSGYFDGTGDTLTTAATTAFDFANNNFTIEAWIYSTSFATNQGICANQDNGTNLTFDGWVIYVGTNGGIGFNDFTNGIVVFSVDSAAGAIKLNTWHHVVVEKRGTGTNEVQVFVDGVAVASGTRNANIPVNTSNQPFTVGNWRYSTDPNREFTGYISNLRIVNSAVYNGTVTVPTAPLTAIANTSLLLNFTNAGIIDNTGKNVLETVGNAQIDTTTKKYGTGSMEFDGTGDYLLVPNTPSLGLEGNFTVEAWVYLTANPPPAGNAAYLIDFRVTSTNNFALGFVESSGVTKMYSFVGSGSVQVIGSTTVSLNAWNHVAYVRSGSTITLYLNGTANGTMTSSYSQPPTAATIASRFTGATEYITGFIDDLRITKGVARYTANFTAPTKAFPDQ